MRRLTLLILLTASAATARKFYDDDPILRAPKPRDTGNLKPRKLSDIYDLFSLQFGDLGERQPPAGSSKPPIRAMGINTIENPFDDNWWEPRHYFRRMTPDELRRGPGDATPPSTRGKWTIVGVKSEGVTPGFRMLDADNRQYFVKFDPMSNPEMATAADRISSKIFHAMGYHVPQNYLIYFKEDQLQLGEDVELANAAGKKRKMTLRDLYEILLKVPKTADGRYRGTASLALPGKPIGPPRYYGSRTDDPNDVVPHEHRRDQRALRVFCAWLGHEDSRAINNIDVALQADGIRYVRHYLLDFGSTLGSASTKPNSVRSGLPFFSWSESAKNFFSLGLHVSYVDFAKYPDLPSVGRFEATTFDPVRWVPEYPNPAFLNALPDDEFWAAKQVMSLTDADLKAIVETGEYSDPKAAEWVTQTLIERRNKIGKALLGKVLPLDRFAIRDGALAWEDISGSAGAVNIQWHHFDNQSEQRTAIPNATSAKLPDFNSSGYLLAELTRAAQPKQKVLVYLRRGESPCIAGVERTW
ncbi:MAG: hypothetical protein K2X03_16735 [Bryobacteraceae bacterium]|nr:hypothetical protein [Bryobacteraceae bacterium]